MYNWFSMIKKEGEKDKRVCAWRAAHCGVTSRQQSQYLCRAPVQKSSEPVSRDLPEAISTGGCFKRVAVFPKRFQTVHFQP